MLFILMIQPSITENLNRDGEGKERLFLFLIYNMKNFPDAFTSMYMQDSSYFDAKPLNDSLTAKKNSHSLPLQSPEQ